MPRILHSDGSAAFDDGMIPLKKPQPASRKLSNPDPHNGDPKVSKLPQRDPGDEDPEPIDEPKDIDQGGSQEEFRQSA